ncbi:MAG: BMP family ABC transporter substrate-binding protein [Planctomycetes bacterium]|nr:BMP family ABC transporter substrate-binding protein [Planctomycetota bacterium]
MKTRLTAILALAALAALIAGALAPVARAESSIRVGMVFDVGGRGDKSFNDAAYRALERAEKDLGIPMANMKYIEPTQTADRETGMRNLAEAGYDVVIGVGFLFTEAVNAVAKEFPDTKFACVDYDIQAGKEIPANVSALKFREEEGAFLVGAIAALTSKTGKVGFVGGMDIPLIHRFQAGYTAGAKAARPDAGVLVNYAGVTPDAFKDPTKGKELGLTQYSSGADIIFHASGSTGLGVFQAAKEKGLLAIGVDSDQAGEAPGHILTSMLKRVDVTVFEVIKEVKAGTFKGGPHVFGLKEDGVGYVYDDANKSLIAAETIAQVEAFKAKIIAGEIKVPNQ